MRPAGARTRRPASPGAPGPRGRRPARGAPRKPMPREAGALPRLRGWAREPASSSPSPAFGRRHGRGADRAVRGRRRVGRGAGGVHPRPGDGRCRPSTTSGWCRPRARPRRSTWSRRASLPRGWRATTAGYTDGRRCALAPRGAHRRRSLRRARAGQPVGALHRRGVRRPRSHPRRPVDVGGVPWATYTDSGGDLALVRHQGRTTTLVVGHDVDRATLVSSRRACADGSARVVVVLVGGDRGVEPLPGAVEPLLADLRELLAALPQRQRLLEGRAAGLEPADHLDQLLAGLLVGELSRSCVAASGPAGSSSVRSLGSAARCRSVVGARSGRRRPGPETAWPAPTWPTRVTHVAVGVLEHGVAALQGGQRRQRRGPGPRWWPMSSAARSSRWCSGAPGPVAQRVDLVGARVDAGRCRGRPAPAGRAARRGACCSRSSQPREQPARQPLARLLDPGAAPRPRRAPPAWRRRSGSRRGRRRPGRAAGCRARGRSRRRPGCGPRAPPGAAPRRRTAAGPRPSRRRGRSRSRRPPGRGRAGRAPRSPRRAARCPAWRRTRDPNRTAGQRRRAFSRTSRSAALSGAVTRPTAPGRNGSRRLQLGGEQPLGGQQLAAPLDAGPAARRARPSGCRGRRARGCRGWRRTTAWRAPRRWRPRPSAG